MRFLFSFLISCSLFQISAQSVDSTSRQLPPPPPPAPPVNPYLIQPSDISYEDFDAYVKEVRIYREERRVSLDTFLMMAKNPNTIILDTRSSNAYRNIHLKGAIHLNFSDFTEEKLAKVIPNKSTRILIYCNNNLRDAEKGFPSKRKPLALNIPTFINLYGYDYRNVYELGGQYSVYHPDIEFVGVDAGRIEIRKRQYTRERK